VRRFLYSTRDMTSWRRSTANHSLCGSCILQDAPRREIHRYAIRTRIASVLARVNRGSAIIWCTSKRTDSVCRKRHGCFFLSRKWAFYSVKDYSQKSIREKRCRESSLVLSPDRNLRRRNGGRTTTRRSSIEYTRSELLAAFDVHGFTVMAVAESPFGSER